MVPSGWLAQGPDFEGWANILFVLVMVALWLLGALVKKISKKGPGGQKEGPPAEPGSQQRESWQERLRRRAEDLQRRMEEEAGLRKPGKPPRPTRPTPASPGGQIRVRPTQGGESVIVYEPPAAEGSTQREEQIARQREAREAVARVRTEGAKVMAPADLRLPVFQPISPAAAAGMGVPPTPLEPAKAQLPSTHEPAGSDLGDVLDYRDPDAVKKAILHYEILGKPLALRDQPEQTSSF
ncbi:MAG: hypothetical protein MUC88_20000 [Planctomycetes bacterium]|nr:hypothetical protein [Planctomycetota bacterium]